MNRLAHSLSPYLRQHANNPVDWHEWSDEAFEEARERDVPVLLSVGYAACHWCHVMAHESFEDPATAAIMNAGFVNIKVDREERPDIDSMYMAALVALTGQGGWPMTVFLTPDGSPFHAGTYFPPTPMHGLPSFHETLHRVSTAWTDRRGDLAMQSGALLEHLRTASESGAAPDPEAGPAVPPDTGALERAVAVLAGQFDRARGGFGGSPKFPPTMTLEQLLRHHARTGSRQALGMLTQTCEAMARGGIYDQLGGGFSRYAVDSAWVVPHFEKMLSDNAQLLGLYARLSRVDAAPWVRRVALETADFLLTDLRVDGGAFASSLDADTEGVEGKFYVWTPAELVEAIGDDDGAWAAALLGVTAAGTFEDGASTLQLRIEPAGEDAARWARARTALASARAARTIPGRDDKVVAGWNGMAIGSLVEAGMILGAPHLVRAAQEAADAVLAVHWDGERLVRVSIDGRAGDAPGALEDYGLLADGLLILFAATGDERWYRVAQELLDAALARFVTGDPADGSARFFDAEARDDSSHTGAGPALLVRPADPGDNASPSGRSALAGALLKLAGLSGATRYRAAAEAALSIYAPLAEAAPRFAGWGLALCEALADGPREVAIILAGQPSAADDGGVVVDHLVRAAWAAPTPGLVIAVGPGADIPLLAERDLLGEASTAYVCRNFACQRPVTDAESLTEQLRGH